MNLPEKTVSSYPNILDQNLKNWFYLAILEEDL